MRLGRGTAAQNKQKRNAQEQAPNSVVRLGENENLKPEDFYFCVTSEELMSLLLERRPACNACVKHCL